MARFFTSDWHLNSNNILKYTKRPFISAEDAASKLVDNCDEVAKGKADVVFHVGDFWKKGIDRHDKNLGEDDANLPATADDYIRFVTARFVLLAGNHDDGHGIEADVKSMMVDLNQNYREVFVTHYPSDNPAYHGRTCANWNFGLGVNLCGHVHDKWLLRYDSQKKILNVNVGVDVWNYKPVRDAEITELLDFIKATMWTKILTVKNFTMTRDDVEKFKIAHSEEVKKQREQRKKEKYEKRGLTPEECQRRKEAAMKAKGLDGRALHSTDG